MKVVVLAGGKGTRLGLSDIPKPMVRVAGRPLLERLVEVGKASGFNDFVFLTGHLAEVIENHFGDGQRFGVSIEHAREVEPLGTAGAVLAARALLTEPFVLLYGDILIDVDLAHFAAFHAARGGLASLFVHPNDHPHDSDLVTADAQGRVTAFLPKPHEGDAFRRNLVNGALYVLDPGAIGFVPEDRPSDWGKDIFPAMLASGARIDAYRSIEYAKDIGTPDRLAKAERDIASGKVARLSRRSIKPAVFLDRDGVLNHERNGVHLPEDLALTEGAAVAVQALNRAGVPAICVTNQPDVAKGLLTEEGLDAVFAALDTRLGAGGAYLDDTYHCPHHPEAGWPGEVAALKVACDCRKPLPGMLLRAAEDHRIDLSRSWMIGDRHVDVAAAHAAGARAVLLRGSAAATDIEPGAPPEHIAETLPQAVEFVLGQIA